MRRTASECEAEHTRAPASRQAGGTPPRRPSPQASRPEVQEGERTCLCRRTSELASSTSDGVAAAGSMSLRGRWKKLASGRRATRQRCAGGCFHSGAVEHTRPGLSGSSSCRRTPQPGQRSVRTPARAAASPADVSAPTEEPRRQAARPPNSCGPAQQPGRAARAAGREHTLLDRATARNSLQVRASLAQRTCMAAALRNVS